MKENDLDENSYKENENSGKNELYCKTNETGKMTNVIKKVLNKLFLHNYFSKDIWLIPT